MSKRIPLTDVELVSAVKSCDSCAWFWQGIKPYGPFPSFNWAEDFPAAIRDQPEASDDPWFHEKTHKACAAGAKYVQPAVLRGCRKAPIMTVGINPNLTAFKSFRQGAEFTYPWFDRDASYAYYYRHATVFQERTDLDYMREAIIPGTELIATADGRTQRPSRGMDHRWMEIPVRYDGDTGNTLYEMAWAPEERAVVFASKDFRKGDIIAARTDPKATGEMQLYAQGVGYYQRLMPVLRLLETAIDAPANSLQMGEDVSMHDMIGCASPGWSDKYDIPQDNIANTCVREKQYMFDQLVQSQPALLIIVSNSSLKMFSDGLDSFGANMDLVTEKPGGGQRDVFDLMKETCSAQRYVSYPVKGKMVKSRIIVTPHFSYGVNFKDQARFNLRAWQGFCDEYPGDAEKLMAADLVGDATYNGYIPLQLDADTIAIGEQLSPAAWSVLMGHHYKPNQMIADALAAEVQQGTLSIDAASGHLQRVSKHCDYCVNDRWQFPEGCRYQEA